MNFFHIYFRVIPTNTGLHPSVNRQIIMAIEGLQQVFILVTDIPREITPIQERTSIPIRDLKATLTNQITIMMISTFLVDL